MVACGPTAGSCPTRGSAACRTRTRSSAWGETYEAIDLKLSPLGAYTLLGFPLSELAGGCVSLADAFGAASRELVDRLCEADRADARFDVLEDFLLRRIDAGPLPEPVA